MFTISSTVKETAPSKRFLAIKDEVLGKKYDLSVVFVGSKRSQTLNKKYRGKDNPANILSFPLSDTEGEIIIDLHQARKEAPRFERDFDNFIAFLFIHGLFHLKGYEHGSTMESKEKAIRKQFRI